MSNDDATDQRPDKAPATPDDQAELRLPAGTVRITCVSASSNMMGTSRTVDFFPDGDVILSIATKSEGEDHDSLEYAAGTPEAELRTSVRE